MMRPHRATILVIWIAIIAVAMTTEVEDADSITSQESATAASAKLYNGLPKDALPKMAIQGIRNLDLWKMANDDAVTTNNKLMKRLSTPWKTKMSKECCKYHRIPWFKLGFMGKRYKNKSKSGCKSLCNQFVGCKSYSYNINEKECIWSPQAVTYDQDWRFYSKATTLNGVVDGTYHMFPGMKFLEPTTDVEKGKSLQECMYSCTQELGCNSFSYSEPRTECARSGQAIGYEENWQYYEKQVPQASPVWKEKHDKENDMKDRLKKDYMNDIDARRTKQDKENKEERARKVTLEVQMKQDGKSAETEQKDAKRRNDTAERDKKTAAKMKESDGKFELKMGKTIAQIDRIEKTSLEIVQKKIVDEKDSAGKAQLMTKKEEIKGQLKMLKEHYDRERMKEKGVKDDFMAADVEANKAAEAAEKEDAKRRDAEYKLMMEKEDAKLEADELASKDCGKMQQKANEKVAEAVRSEKNSKTKLANEEGQVAVWFKRAQMATNENHKKKYDAALQESKESLDKTTETEQKNIKSKDDATRHANKQKAKCQKKVEKEKTERVKIENSKEKAIEEKRAQEETEKRKIKVQSQQREESEVKESQEKEGRLKEAHRKSKREKLSKKDKSDEMILKEKKKKIEVKEKETVAKELAHKKMVADAEKKELEIKESTKKTKVKEELDYKEKYFKNSKAIEKAAKDSAEMTKEVNDKEHQTAEAREEAARSAEATANKRAVDAKNEKEFKFQKELLSKAEANTFAAKMKRPHLQVVRRNDAGVIKVPAAQGLTMFGGGIINHYRKWNRKAIFEESYPDGDSWRCDTGQGNSGQATCISLSYKMPEGTKCVNTRTYTVNAGVVHATLPPGYIMVSGGVQNLHRRFDRHSAFEQSMPAGDNKWRCDMGYGRGELNCFARGCKFPFGAHCVTTEGSSDNAGWVWAECPAGYQVTGCGMRNNYLNFDVKSGFEDLRPIGNKCMGDMGFGPGRVSVFARCCKVNPPPPKIKGPPPPPKVGTANPDNVKCAGDKKWELKSNTDCAGGDLESIPIPAGQPIQKGMDTCAFKCASQFSCKGFSFPTSTKGGMCKLKGSSDHIYSDELQKFCDSETPSNEFNSYAKLHGPCTKGTGSQGVDTSKIISPNHRRRADTTRRRGSRLGEGNVVKHHESKFQKQWEEKVVKGNKQKLVPDVGDQQWADFNTAIHSLDDTEA